LQGNQGTFDSIELHFITLETFHSAPFKPTIKIFGFYASGASYYELTLIGF